MATRWKQIFEFRGIARKDEERRKKKEKGKKRIKVAINSVSIEEGKFT